MAEAEGVSLWCKRGDSSTGVSGAVDCDGTGGEDGGGGGVVPVPDADASSSASPALLSSRARAPAPTVARRGLRGAV